jgi:hypothetical protein
MKKYSVPPYIIATLFILSGISCAYAAGASISGDEVCGATATTACSLSHIGVILKGVLKVIIALGLPLTIVFISYRFVMAWFALQQGNANAYKEALQKSGNAMLGFLLIVALFGGLLTVFLKYFGVKDQPLKLLELLSSGFVEHAYAQARPDGLLPNFFGSDDIYDLLLSAFRLIMRFFIYPSLIVIWVWTGFSFVMAQGAPEALTKAKKWLLWAFLTTLVIFVLQGFLVAMRGTVEKILPGSTTTSSSQSVSVGTLDGRGQPVDGALGSACTTSSGSTGQIGSDGTCSVGRGAGSSNTSQYCAHQSTGTMCVVSGTGSVGVCGIDSSNTTGCYAAFPGKTCLTSNRSWGVIDAAGASCVAGGSAPTVTNSTGGSYGGTNYDSSAQGNTADIPCTVRNGGTCRIYGQAGTCSDFTCKI